MATHTDLETARDAWREARRAVTMSEIRLEEAERRTEQAVRERQAVGNEVYNLRRKAEEAKVAYLKVAEEWGRQ